MVNNIGLIISGNLTGFSRFYASPTVDAYKEAKFDFDYRNFVTFLKNQEKAYVISFSRNVISVSLVNRTLDSFRRPGILVISILMHRNEKVEFIDDPQNKRAIYQLLHEINNKFYEKNFINGMLNQNAAVLMQDYYTPILAKYLLRHDSSQRLVNINIDETLPNKKIGYICSSEENVPLYLSSLCRSSYRGFHHVIFAENANQNIDEEPVEVVLYSVSILNNKRISIPPVRLSDNIYDLQPEYGERNIPKNFTYQQILNGESSHINGTIKGDMLELNYRFLKEQKTVLFKFMEDGQEIPFEKINLVVFNKDETQINVPSNPFTFEGREIYDGIKTLKSGNDDYKFNTNINLQTISDGTVINVHVVHVTRYPINFGSCSKPKEITFYNTKTSKSLPFHNVTQYFSELIPGNIEDWEITIDSYDYKRIRKRLPPLGQQINIVLEPIPLATNMEKAGKLSAIETTLQKDNNSVRLCGGNSPKQETNKRKNKYLMIAGCFLTLLILIIGCWKVFIEPLPSPKPTNPKTKKIILYVQDTYEDKNKKEKHDRLKYTDWKNLLKINVNDKLQSDNSCSTDGYLFYSIKVEAINSKELVKIYAKFRDKNIGKLNKSFSTLKDIEVLTLEVAASKLKKSTSKVLLRGSSTPSHFQRKNWPPFLNNKYGKLIKIQDCCNYNDSDYIICNGISITTRAKALENAILQIQDKKIPKTRNLSKEQRLVIENLSKLKSSSYSYYLADFNSRSCTSLFYVDSLITCANKKIKKK